MGDPSDAADLYAACVGRFAELLAGVDRWAWDQPTPCVEWNVRQLADHVADELAWAVPTFGEPDETSNDPLGSEPPAAAQRLASQASDAVRSADPDGELNVSGTSMRAGDLLAELTADAAIHIWDLATATAQPHGLGGRVIERVDAWFDGPRESDWRRRGLIGPAGTGETDADALSVLVARFGRDPASAATIHTLAGLYRACNRRDTGAILELLSADCVFEDTSPPDGNRHTGRDEIAGIWEEVFAGAPQTSFVVEEGFVAGERACYRSVYTWSGDEDSGHVRSMDALRVSDGKVTEVLSYVKG